MQVIVQEKIENSHSRPSPLAFDAKIQCARCLLDSHDDSTLELDAAGLCNYCRDYDLQAKRYLKEGLEGEQLLREKAAEIKRNGAGKKYDCILGLSGGIDSSYIALLAKTHGLRPLCIHFDNGWNSEIAVRNIHNIVERCGFDLETYVVDWEEFKGLQLAYLRASVIDIEVITDHAIYSVIYQAALKHGVKYVLSGQNLVTEGVLPPVWSWRISDFVNIKAINKRFGKAPLRSYPLLSRRLKKRILRSGIESVEFLNWTLYRKADAIERLEKEFGWLKYGNKHHESIWTRFFQTYILPRKFGVDKRKAHLSNLVCSGQLTREEALAELEKPPCDPALLKQDQKFVLKKLGLTDAEFEGIMRAPIRDHREFDTEGSLFHYYPVLKPFRPLWERFKKLRGNGHGHVYKAVLLFMATPDV